MSDEELFEAAKKQKEDGNTLFKEKKFSIAKTHYSEAIQYLETLKDMNEEMRKLKVTCH